MQSGIIIFYRARPVGGELRPGDDAAETAVFAADALPADLAFRTHRSVLARWAGLQGTVAPFDTIPDEFYPLAPDLHIRLARLDDEKSILGLLPLIPANEGISRDGLHAVSLRFRESTALDVLVAEHAADVVGFLVLSFVDDSSETDPNEGCRSLPRNSNAFLKFASALPNSPRSKKSTPR